MPIHLLGTDKAVRKITAPGYHGDGGGLALRVVASDRTGKLSRSWVFRYGSPKKEERIGSLEEVGAAEARDIAKRFRQMLRDGKSPKLERRRLQHAAAGLKTFGEVAEMWLAARELQPLKPITRYQSRGTVAKILPLIGDVPIQDLDIRYVMDTLRAVSARGVAVAHATQVAIRGIVDFADANGYRDGNRRNPADSAAIRAAGIPGKPFPKTRRPLHWADIHELLTTLEQVQDVIQPRIRSRGRLNRVPDYRMRQYALALRLLILTGVRRTNACQARREDFDLEKRLWTIPGAMMKGRLTTPPPDHYVPLSDAAMAVVEEAMTLHGEPGYLFLPNPHLGKSSRKLRPWPHIQDFKPLLLKLGIARKTGPRTYAMDFELHGFRSTLSTWANERGFNSSDVELVLAHARPGIAKHYDHSTRIPQRREILDAWGAFCTHPYDARQRARDNVVVFPKSVRSKRIKAT